MVLWTQVAVVPHAALTAPTATYLQRVSVADTNGSLRSFHFSFTNTSLKIFFCEKTCTEHTEKGPLSDIQLWTQFSSKSSKLPRRLSILISKKSVFCQFWEDYTAVYSFGTSLELPQASRARRSYQPEAMPATLRSEHSPNFS